MSEDGFDPDDLAALRRLTARAASAGTAPARQDSGPTEDKPAVQLNVRVRAVTKDAVLRLARAQGLTAAQVIEQAVQELEAALRPQDRETSR